MPKFRSNSRSISTPVHLLGTLFRTILNAAHTLCLPLDAISNTYFLFYQHSERVRRYLQLARCTNDLLVYSLTDTVTCFRRSSGEPTGKRSNPNDYTEKQKNTPKPKDQKKEQKKEKQKNQKQKKQKNGKDQSPPLDMDMDGVEAQQHKIDYEFGETETDLNMYTDNTMQYDDTQFYPSEDIYTNDPQFQPPMM